MRLIDELENAGFVILTKDEVDYMESKRIRVFQLSRANIMWQREQRKKLRKTLEEITTFDLGTTVQISNRYLNLIKGMAKSVLEETQPAPIKKFIVSE
jgi:hypothetical protein